MMERATDYVAWADHLKRRSRNAAASLAQTLAPREGTFRIFDFGFGDGELLCGLAARLGNCEIFGADTDSTFVPSLTKELPGSHLAVGDGNEILVKIEARFDLILMSHVFYYFPRDQWSGIIAHAAQRLRPGGKIALAMVSQYSAAYQEPVSAIMAAAGCSAEAISTDGGRFYAEDLAALLPDDAQHWELGWDVELDSADLAAFLCFLYRFGEGLPKVLEVVEKQPLPGSLAMRDRWTILTRQQALSLRP